MPSSSRRLRGVLASLSSATSEPQERARYRSDLSPEQRTAYERDGFVLVKGVFTEQECDAFVALAEQRKREQMAWREKFPDERMPPRERRPGGVDPEIDMVLSPKIRDPLRGCMEVDGWQGSEAEAIQTMYFWQGSEQRRHQDQFYLPECMSAWTAFEDVSPRNGTVFAQVGSHKGRLATKDDFKEGGCFFEMDYNDAVDAIFAENAAAGMAEVPILAQKGDVLYFHGVLVHRGGPIEEKGTSRHVFANHYVPSQFRGDAPDRRGAGNATQYDNWSRGGIGRWSLASMPADGCEKPTSLEFGVLPDGSGRAFLRQDQPRDAGEAVHISESSREAYERRKRAEAEARDAGEAGAHVSPGEKLKRQLGLDA